MQNLQKHRNMCGLKTICDAIKQNESELEKMKSQFSFSLYAPTSEQYHTEISVKIKHTVREI